MAEEFETPKTLPDLGEDIDNETFGQIYEMDEDDDHSFSLQIVREFFEQAYDTFQEMDQLLTKEDLGTLSERGHYLKGSSATLGLVKVKDSCEAIQRFGKMENLEGGKVDDEEECRERLKEALALAKVECNRAERILKGFYNLPIPDELKDGEENKKNIKDDLKTASKPKKEGSGEGGESSQPSKE